MARFKLIADGDKQQLLQRGGRGLSVLSEYRIGEQPLVSLSGSEHQSQVMEYEAWAAERESDEVSTEAESASTDAGSNGEALDVNGAGVDWSEAGEEVTEWQTRETQQPWATVEKWSKSGKKRLKQVNFEANDEELEAEPRITVPREVAEPRITVPPEKDALAGVKGMKKGVRAKTEGKVAQRKKLEEQKRKEAKEKPMSIGAKAQRDFAKWLEQRSRMSADDIAKEENWPDGKDFRDSDSKQRSELLKEAGQTRKSRRPRLLDTTNAELAKLHRQRHTPAATLLTWLLTLVSALDRVEWQHELTQFALRVESICNSCRGCQLAEHKVKSKSVIPRNPDLKSMMRAWLDLFCLNFAQSWWAVGLVEEADDELCLGFCKSKQSYIIFDELFFRWLSIRGYTALFVSDQAKELIGKEFVELGESHGIQVGVSGAGRPQGHSRIERKFRALRHALECETEGYERPQNEREWRYFLCGFENAARSEVTTAGYSSSQRATGKGCSLLRTAWDDTPVTAQVPASESVARLLAVQEMGKAAFLRTVNSRKIRAILHEKDAPEVRIREVGELVWFRKAGPDNARRWAGLGVVTGYDPVQEIYTVTQGVWTYHPARLDVKGRDEMGLTDVNPVKEEDEKPGEERVVEGGRIAAEEKETSDAVKALEVVEEEQRRELLERGKEDANVQADLRRKELMSEAQRKQLCEAQQRYERRPNGKWGAEGESEQPGQGYAAGSPKAVEMDEGSPVAAVATMEDWWGNGYTPEQEEKEAARRKSEEFREERRLSMEEKERAEKTPNPRRVAMRHEHEDPVRRDVMPELHKRTLDDLEWQYSFLAHEYDMSTYVPGIDCFASCVSERVRPLFAPESVLAASVPCFAGQKGGAGAYGVSFNDLDAEIRWASRMKGCADLTEHGCWDPNEVLMRSDVKRNGVLIFDAHWVDKAKWDEIAELMIGRSRWTPHGYQQWREKLLTQSPTASLLTHVFIEVFGRYNDWIGFRFDISSAFFQGEFFDEADEAVYIKVPEEEVERLELPKVPGGYVRRLWKEIPGTKSAPRAFYDVLVKSLLGTRDGLSMVQSSYDPCMFWAGDGGCEARGSLAIHVDDGKGRADLETAKRINERLEEAFPGKVKWIWEYELEHGEENFVGIEWKYFDDRTELSQREYISEELHEIHLSAERFKRVHDVVTAEEKAQLMSANGCLRWAAKTLPKQAFLVHSATCIAHHPEPTIAMVKRFNKIIRTIRHAAEKRIGVWTLPKLNKADGELRGLVIGDSGCEKDSDVYDSKWTGGKVICLRTRGDSDSKVAILGFKSAKVDRVAWCSFDGEAIVLANSRDAARIVMEIASEAFNGPKLTRSTIALNYLETGEQPANRYNIGCDLLTDCKSLEQRVNSLTNDPLMKKARKDDVNAIKEVKRLFNWRILHINGPTNPVDSFTKDESRCSKSIQYLDKLIAGEYVPDFGVETANTLANTK